VCTGHCTVQCPVHRQPRAKIPFSCALSGGLPDSYYALSGVHRTGTVDCLVRPYSVFKKSFSARARRLAHFSPLPGFSLYLWRSLATSLLSGDPPATLLLLIPFPLSGENPSLSLSLFLSVCAPVTCEVPFFHLLHIFQFPVKSSETKWPFVFLCVS
jgi:hypothetical protein